jgi:hypothetical protein
MANYKMVKYYHCNLIEHYKNFICRCKALVLKLQTKESYPPAKISEGELTYIEQEIEK